MPNLCFNNVILVGAPEKLTRIANYFKDKPTMPLEELQELLQFQCKGWGHSTDEGISGVEIDQIEQGALPIRCTTAWDDVPMFWDALVEQEGLEGYASLSDNDSEYWTRNDPEGIWFIYDYIFDEQESFSILGAESESFESKEKLVNYLNTCSKETRTYDEWVEWCEDNDCGAIKTVEHNEGTQTQPYSKEALKSVYNRFLDIFLFHDHQPMISTYHIDEELQNDHILYHLSNAFTGQSISTFTGSLNEFPEIKDKDNNDLILKYTQDKKLNEKELKKIYGPFYEKAVEIYHLDKNDEIEHN